MQLFVILPAFAGGEKYRVGMSSGGIANKDEAKRCRDMGTAALKRGDLTRAIKMFRKCLSLHPLPGIETLLRNAESAQTAKASSAARDNGCSSSEGNGVRQRNSGQKENGGTSANGNRPYTEEQAKGALDILKLKEKGHYAVLAVDRNASEDQIKRA